ncbi:MAG: alanine racemase [Deltaproteobacteria bacterium]|nr:alanine racemase [Deltaproteobacteria bacterium]
MSIWYSHVRTEIRLDRLRSNYRFLAFRAGQIMPVIKADAYGHGLGPAAAVLAQAGAEMLAVGTVHESVALRLTPFEGRILALLGILDPEEIDALWEYRITPMVHDRRTLGLLGEACKSRGRELEVALKFDTGMSRLGFGVGDMVELLGLLRDYPGIRPVMVCSHLAVADEAQGRDYVLAQGREFASACEALRAGGCRFLVSLANSAATLAYPELWFDVCRPGIALYGANPLADTAERELGSELKPAMEVRAPILSVHDLPRGRSIHYGLTFTAPRDMRVAIVGIGYADNYPRVLSNTGAMVVHGVRAPVVGRVCMQMTAVDVTGLLQAVPGDWAWVLGGPGPEPITPEELAGWWGTITYEVFCLLGQNRRIYTDGEH